MDAQGCKELVQHTPAVGVCLEGRNVEHQLRVSLLVAPGLQMHLHGMYPARTNAPLEAKKEDTCADKQGGDVAADQGSTKPIFAAVPE